MRTISKENIIILLEKGLDSLFLYDKRNIEMDVSEMNLCSRLAHYIQNLMYEHPQKYKGYFVDTEYNRNYDGTIKKVEYSKEGPKSVRCDLLIHSRGLKDPDNLLALEMKKKGTMRKVIEDYDRLEGITKPRDIYTPKECVCGTIVGVFLEISNKGYKMNIIWYMDGSLNTETREKEFNSK